MKPDQSPARCLHDAGLQPQRLPALHGDLLHAGSTLRLSGAARADALLTLAGRRARATGSELSGFNEVWLQSTRVASNIHAGHRADFIAVSPGFVRRSGHGMEESVCLPRDAAAVLWHWRTQDTREFHLQWSIPLEHNAERGSTLRWNRGACWLLIQQASQCVLYCFNRDVLIEVQGAHDSLTAQASLELQAAESLAFIVAAAPSLKALADLAGAFDQIDALPRAREAAWNRLERERLTLHTPFAELDQAWRWALYRLDSCLSDAGGAHMVINEAGDTLRFQTFDAVHVALAALGVGDFQTARQVIEFLASTQNRSGAIAASGALAGARTYDGPESTAQFLLLLARHFAWSGDIGFTRKLWPQVRRSIADQSSGFCAQLLRELAVTAESIGESADSGALKAQAEISTQQHDPFASWLTYLPGNGSLEERWLAHLRGGLEQRGSWRDLAASTSDNGADALSTALALSPLLYGVLGAVPDAARHRLELRPRIPCDSELLDVHGLRVADSRISLQYRRSGSEHTFVLQPLEGMVPLRVILEAAVAADGITGVTVDGKAAVLDMRHSNDRWICPLQVMLDHERTVVIQATSDQGA